MPISFTGAHFPKEMIRTGVRWYVADPWSTRNLGEMMLERHLRVDHSTMNRWVIKYSLQLEAKCHRRKRPVWSRWQLVEIDQTVKGQGVYLYRTVDKRRKRIHTNHMPRTTRPIGKTTIGGRTS